MFEENINKLWQNTFSTLLAKKINNDDSKNGYNDICYDN